MRAPPAQAPPRFSRTGTRGQEPVAGAFAGDRYPGRVPKGAACEVTLLRAARAASPRTSFMISISSPPRASAAALALPLSRADAHLVAVHAAAAAAAAAAAPTDDACGNVHARPRHCTRCVRRHGARHSLFRSPLPLARTRRRSLACSRARRRRRWGWGWRSVTPRVTRVTRITRARVHVTTAHRARHHRSSSPHAPTRARCDGGGARSLDSARGVWRLRWRWRAVEVAGGYIARHARYARRASRACTRTSSLRIARVITIFRPPRARPARARCCERQK